MTDTTDRKPEWLKLPPIPAELREAFDAVDLSDPDTWGALVYDEVGEVTDEHYAILRDRVEIARLTAELAAERARCDEIAGFVREHRARIHRPTCMDGNGCRCGLADLPMWGERDERRGARA